MSKEMQQSQDLELYKLRHSLAHILAYAVQTLWPNTKLGFGPPIDDGLYYDFIFENPISDADFPQIEKTMRSLIQKNLSFSRQDLDGKKALEKINSMGEPYKAEYAQELLEKKGLKELGFYQTGEFIDMCDGPHVESTKKIPVDCFKLRSLSGAFWRGDGQNQMMTRIYVWAFKSKEELKEHIRLFEEAQRRDHKKLGKELDLFIIDDEVGKGLPLWTPKGTAIRDELEKLMKELEFKDGYERVATPHLAKIDLYYKTGHMPYYEDGIFPIMDMSKKEDSSSNAPVEKYCLRPMNCPHHHKIYAARTRSYRELPLRLAEYGQVYRYEDSGSLSGLLRVRGMCMNDAHIYCTPEQVKAEFIKVMELHKKVYSILGLKDFYLRLSCWDPEDPKAKKKYVDDPKSWAIVEDKIKEAMQEINIPYVVVKGEAAFYGPKIDIQFKSVTGREETASTCQLDFAVPKRLGLTFTDENNQEVMPYVIHRAPLGTHERFVAFLIEHYAGAFPTWLAPIQVQIIAISDQFNDYAFKVQEQLRELMVRSEVDLSPHSFNKKIRLGSTQKIPHLLILGEKEKANNTVTIRHYGKQQQDTMALDSFLEWIQKRIRSRSLE